MTQWYYADHNRQQQGPVAAAEVARLYRQGRVGDATLVWREGLSQWQPLGAHRSELGLDQPVPPPAPVAAPPAPQPAPAPATAPVAAEPAAWQPAEPVLKPVLEPVLEPVAEPVVPGTAASGVAPVAEPVLEPATPEQVAGPALAEVTSPHHGSAPEPRLELEPLAPTAAPGTGTADGHDGGHAWTTAEASQAYSPYAAPVAAATGYYAPQAAGEVVLAGFWKRVAAYLIDSVIVGVAGTLVGMVLALFALPLALSDDSGAATAIMHLGVQLFSILLTAVYYAAFHASRGGATPGKMAIGIKVVRTDGSRISLLRGIGRYFATILSSLILCIGYLMAAFTQRKQALHDMVCDTLVVDKWAFTEHPEWQRRELGTLTIVVLVLGGLLLVGALVALVAMIGVIASLAA